MKEKTEFNNKGTRNISTNEVPGKEQSTDDSARGFYLDNCNCNCLAILRYLF